MNTIEIYKCKLVNTRMNRAQWDEYWPACNRVRCSPIPISLQPIIAFIIIVIVIVTVTVIAIVIVIIIVNIILALRNSIWSARKMS